ncbi:hypothetical protein ACLOJK_019221 [Asimina triloba]
MDSSPPICSDSCCCHYDRTAEIWGNTLLAKISDLHRRCGLPVMVSSCRFHTLICPICRNLLIAGWKMIDDCSNGGDEDVTVIGVGGDRRWRWVPWSVAMAADRKWWKCTAHARSLLCSAGFGEEDCHRFV